MKSFPPSTPAVRLELTLPPTKVKLSREQSRLQVKVNVEMFVMGASGIGLGGFSFEKIHFLLHLSGESVVLELRSSAGCVGE